MPSITDFNQKILSFYGFETRVYPVLLNRFSGHRHRQGMAFGVGAGGQAAPSAAELGGLLSGSPSTTMWGAAAHPRYSMPSSTSLAASSLAAAAAGHASSVPFPATPFNTPSQGTVRRLPDYPVLV